MRVTINLQQRLPDLAAALGDDIGEFAFEVVLALEAETKRLIQHSTPTGRVYRRGGIYKTASKRLLAAGFQLSRTRQGKVIAGAKFHRASAPGQPPATDSATLVNSIRAKRTSAVSAELQINAGYAGLLEEGTGRMAARPFVEPSIDFVLEHQLADLGRGFLSGN